MKSFNKLVKILLESTEERITDFSKLSDEELYNLSGKTIDAAKEYANKKGYNFLLLTEDQLF